MSKHRTTPEQWQRLVTQQQNSGVSAPQFCKQHDIAYASFCYWRKRLATVPKSVTPVESAEPQTSGFLDLSSLMTGAAPDNALCVNIALSHLIFR